MVKSGFSLKLYQLWCRNAGDKRGIWPNGAVSKNGGKKKHERTVKWSRLPVFSISNWNVLATEHDRILIDRRKRSIKSTSCWLVFNSLCPWGWFNHHPFIPTLSYLHPGEEIALIVIIDRTSIQIWNFSCSCMLRKHDASLARAQGELQKDFQAAQICVPTQSQ